MLKIILENIKTNKGRWVLSPIPYVVFIIFVFFVEGSNFENVIERELNVFIVMGFISLIVSYIGFFLLSGLIENWRTKKVLRIWVFTSTLWAVGVYIYVIMFGPFGRGMYSDDYVIVNMSALIPPIFIGTGYFVYNKFIK